MLAPPLTPLRTTAFVTARTLACALLFCGSVTAVAQTPQPVLHEGDARMAKWDRVQKMIPCTDNDAGTISVGRGTGQSTDLSLDTLFLCFGDTVLIDHNGDQRLDGDPDKSTPAGVGYAWYDCKPTATGPTRIAVEADRCLIPNPTSEPGTGAFFISTGGRLDGDQKFWNDGSVQTRFGAGAPKLIWFAPITFDKLEPSGPKYERSGSCVSVSTRAAFAVVYLNEVTTSNLAVSNCGGSFRIDGGLPQYSNRARYTVEIVHRTKPSVRGKLLNPDVRAGNTAQFSVPEAGTYDIVVRDAKGCKAVALAASVMACVPLPKVTIDIDSLKAAPNTEVCVPVRATGFTGITRYRFDLDYDEVRLRYERIQNINPAIAPFSIGPGPSKLNVDVTVPVGSSQTVPNGAILFEVCFKTLGTEGEFGTVVVTPPAAGILFQAGAQALDLGSKPGGVLITNQPFGLLLRSLPGCGGENVNAISIGAFGGMAPYTVLYGSLANGPVRGPLTLNSNADRVQTPADLAPGDYTIRVVAQNGSVATGTIRVVDGPVLSVNVTIVSELRCRDDVSGALRAVPLLDFSTPGNPDDYTYTWTKDGVTIASTQTINGLTVGEYKVRITDLRGCVAQGMGTIFSPRAIDARPLVTDATCTGPGDGLIEIQPSGGTSATGDYAYTITFPNGSIGNRRGPELMLDGNPGTYLVTVTDDNGCRAKTTSTIQAEREIATSAVVDSISCFGLTDGSIVVTGRAAFGAAPRGPLSFNWSGDPRGTTDNTPTSSTISGLAQGTFFVLMTDADRCEARDSFTLTEPPLLVATLAGKGDESCVPGVDGFAEVTVTGGTPGTPAYTYAWSNENGDIMAKQARAAGLRAGSYQVVVTDGNGCRASLAAPVEVDSPQRPRIDSLFDTQVACFGNTNGTLTVEASATSSPLARLEWSTGASTATISGLAAGTYTVTVYDQAGCATVDSARVIQPDRLAVADSVLVGPKCFQQGDGAIEVTVAGGTAPYSYSWTDGTSGVGANRISGPSITAGAYIVTIVDANDCRPLQKTYRLAEAPSIDPDFSSIKRASCAIEVCDGGAVVEAQLPGSPDARFNFVWQSGERTDGAVRSQATMLCGGRNALFIQESSLVCPPQEFPVNVPAPDPLAIEVGSVVDARCFGESSGLIEIAEVFGGIPGYTFEWRSSTGTQSGNKAIDLAADTVTLLIRDKDNCPYRDTFVINEPPELTLTEDTTKTFHPTCFGDTDGAISLVIRGGNSGGGKTMRWNDEPGRNSVEARKLRAGTYVAQVTDRKGCTAEATVTLTQPDEIEYRVADYDPIKCFGDFTFVVVDTAFGGRGEVPADYQVSVNGSSFQVLGTRFQVPGGQPISVEVVDPTGCQAFGEIVVETPPAITVRLPAKLEVELGDSVRIRPSVFPGGAPLVLDSLRWTPDTSLVYVGANRLSPFAKPLADITYTLTIIDEDGCSQSASVLIDVDRNRNFYIPTAFSPNNDAVNDQLQVFSGPGVRRIASVSIYNRWGELIREAEDLPLSSYGETIAWDGNFRGQLVDAGVYVYVAKVEFLDGREIVYKGSVSVVY